MTANSGPEEVSTLTGAGHQPGLQRAQVQPDRQVHRVHQAGAQVLPQGCHPAAKADVENGEAFNPEFRPRLTPRSNIVSLLEVDILGVIPVAARPSATGPRPLRVHRKAVAGLVSHGDLEAFAGNQMKF